jgi:hypothetical protein
MQTGAYIFWCKINQMSLEMCQSETADFAQPLTFTDWDDGGPVHEKWLQIWEQMYGWS